MGLCRKCLLSLALCAVCASVAAAGSYDRMLWDQMAKNPDVKRYLDDTQGLPLIDVVEDEDSLEIVYIYPNTIEEGSGHRVAWFYTIEADFNRRTVTTSRQYWEFLGNRGRLKAFKTYSRKGRETESGSPGEAAEWNNFAPGTFGESMHRYLFGNQQQRQAYQEFVRREGHGGPLDDEFRMVKYLYGVGF